MENAVPLPGQAGGTAPPKLERVSLFMDYQLDPTKPLGAEIARAARELLRDGALIAAAADESLEERVHRARTSSKKVRALLRLLRARHRGFFRRENRRLRDAAAGLAAFRDADVVLTAVRLLQPTGHATRPALQGLCHCLTAHRRALMADGKTVETHLTAFTRTLNESLASVKAWQPRERDFTAIASEIEGTYRRARRLAKRVARAPSGREYHQWRKAVKAFGYQCRLLRRAWPEATKPFAKEAGRLGELLGAEHDLTVLGDFVKKADKGVGPGKSTLPPQPILKLIDRRRRDFRRQAHTTAERLFAEKPRAYGARLHRWWEHAAKHPIATVASE